MPKKTLLALVAPILFPFAHVYSSDALKNRKADKVSASVAYTLPKISNENIEAVNQWPVQTAMFKNENNAVSVAAPVVTVSEDFKPV